MVNFKEIPLNPSTINCPICRKIINHIGVLIGNKVRCVCAEHNVIHGCGDSHNHGHHVNGSTGEVICTETDQGIIIAQFTDAKLLENFLGDCDPCCLEDEVDIANILGQVEAKANRQLEYVLSSVS